MLAICDFCKKPKFNVSEQSVSDSPGGGQIYHICSRCLAKGRLPKSFEERMGITNLNNSDAKFVRFIGKPDLSETQYGQNAYGSILAEYSDGSRIGVICGHGGSGWLCLSCAEAIMKEQQS